MSNYTIMFLFPMIKLISLGGLFGGIRFRVMFFAWMTVLRNILTMSNLKKQYVIVVEWCCMCKKNGDSVNHLLLHCEIPSALWNTIFSSDDLGYA